MTYWWKGRWPRPRAKPALRSRQQLLTIVLCAIQLIQTSVNAGDCLSSRSDLGENDFILECTEDGNYKPIQCDNKTGYCFCVDQITGRPKSDTTTRNRSPNCDKSSINHSSSSATSSLPAPSYHHQVAPQSSSGYSSRKPKQSRDGNNNNKKRRVNRRCPVGKRISFLSQLLSVIKNELHNRGLPGQLPTRSNSGNSGGNIRYPFGIPLGIRPKNSHNSVAPEPDIELISKKFNDFDTNSDQRMSPDEMRELISSIRLILDAHLDGCVNSLFDFCDTDQNSMISREEFVHCLDVRNTPKLNAAYSKRKKELRGRNSQEQQQDVSSSSSSEERTSSERTSGGISREMFSQPVYRPPQPQARPQTSNPQPSRHHQTGSGASLNQRRNVEQSLAMFISANSLSPDGAGGVAGVTTGAGNTGHISLLAESSPIGRKKESRKDCLVTQSNANESAQSNSRGSVFIPNCTKEGYYVSVQCHLSHCWCVSPISGQPIKHLLDNSTQSMRVCDLISKGCDHRRRTKFHARLRQLLQHSKQSCESVFGRIDRNRNQQLEQTEWKQYQQRLISKGSTTTTTTTSMTFNSRLQKCFRTEVNYCDQNGDEMVSKPEWIQCCNDNVSTTSSSSNGSNGNGSKFHHQSGSSSSPTSSFHASAFDAYNQKKNRHRSGPNPFKTILKSE